LRENAVSHFPGQVEQKQYKKKKKSQSNNRGGSWRPCNRDCEISAVWDIGHSVYKIIWMRPSEHWRACHH